MVFDLDLIQKLYAELPAKLKKARKKLGRPMPLAEKILYSHLHKESPLKEYTRGVDYVSFAPDRVAMQDATAQMALLQFAPSTATTSFWRRTAQKKTLLIPLTKTRRCSTSSPPFPTNTASVSGSRALASSTRLCWRTTPSPVR
jgi:hypothetical protein